MINKLVLENLRYRWVRTLLSAIMIGVQVMLILTLVGLSRGMLEDSAQRARGVGADIFLKPDTGGTISFSAAQVPEKFVPFVAQQPHVNLAVGMYSTSVQVITYMNGVDFNQFKKLNGGFHFLQGNPPSGPDDLIVDEYYAKQNKIHVGDTVKLLNHAWHVCAIVESGMLSRLIVPIKTLQRLTGNLEPPRITQIAVKLDNRALTNQVVAQLNQKLKGNLQALSAEELESQYSISNIPALKAFIYVVIALSLLVGLLVVFLSMYTAVIERTREIGILKALGAKPVTILNILVREAVLLAIAGSIIGIILSYGSKALIMGLVPASLQVVAVPDWWPIAAGIAIGGSLVGVIYPGLKAARQDAIEALAYD